MTRRQILAAGTASAAFHRAEAATDLDVIVIGAGAAGLAATDALRAAGVRVACLEARSRIGGRAVTDTETFGVPVDRGAHWLHSRSQNPWVRIGHDLGLTVYDAPDNMVLTKRDGTKGNLQALWQAYAAAEAAIARQARRRDDAPLSDVIALDTVAQQTAAAMIALSMARDLQDISAEDWYSATGGQDSFCREGFGTLVATQHRGTPATLDTPVRRIGVTGSRVTVATDTGERSARACILTAPLGVLQAGVIGIDPAPAGGLAHALSGFSMGTYNHTFLQFAPGTIDTAPDTWALRDLPTGAMPTGVLCRLAGHDICMVETSGSAGRALEQAGQAAMVDQAVEEVSAIFGTAVRTGLQTTSAARWGAEDWTRGSYSGAHPGAAGLRKHLRAPIADRLFLAGEMCHPTLQATVAGARLDGQRAARDVLAALT